MLVLIHEREFLYEAGDTMFFTYKITYKIELIKKFKDIFILR